MESGLGGENGDGKKSWEAAGVEQAAKTAALTGNAAGLGGRAWTREIVRSRSERVWKLAVKTRARGGPK